MDGTQTEDTQHEERVTTRNEEYARVRTRSTRGEAHAHVHVECVRAVRPVWLTQDS